MIVAQAKKKENIIEYILYMWQVEDLLRANNLQMDLIDKNIIAKYDQPADKILEIRDWWENLVEMMHNEHKEKVGHLQVNINTVSDVYQLHLELIKSSEELMYQQRFQDAVPFIQEFELKSSAPYENDIELCITAIYSLFLLKLKGAEISKGTMDAITVFSNLLALLAAKYKLDQQGKLRRDE